MGNAPFWSSSVNGRPSFTESHEKLFADTTGAGRPSATLLAPSSLSASPTTLRPLVIVLSSRANAVLTMLSDSGMANLANDPTWGPNGALVLPLSGKTGSSGINSWNGDLCCCWAPADGAAPNDSDYINSAAQWVIDRGWPVDPKRIYIYAQGGGGTAPALRTACDHPTRWAAVFDFAGSGPVSADTIGGTDPVCNPAGAANDVPGNSRHVNFFHLHGTSDASQEPYSGQTVSLNAGMVNHCPAAVSATLGTGTIAQLAAFNGCSGSLSLTTSQWADLVSVGSPTAETDLFTFSGCPSDGTVLFGSMNGEDHSVSTDAKTPDFAAAVITYFLAHPKP